MDCETARQAISALLDGEPTGIPRQELDRHLESCAGCRCWQERAHEVTRRIRLAAAQSTPAAPEAVREAARRFPARRLAHAGALARIGLVAVALAQVLWVTVPALLLGQDRGAPVHVAHEMGSFDIALAVGFLVAAWRPERAQGMRALVGTAAAALAITALVDLLGAHTTLADEAPHLLALAGWLLLRRLATPDPSRRHERIAAPGWPAWPRPRQAGARLGARPRPVGHLDGLETLRAEHAQTVSQDAYAAARAARAATR